MKVEVMEDGKAHIRWLNKRAQKAALLESRVEELEETALLTHNMQADSIRKLEKENQRFKQAMEKAIRQLLNNDLPVKKCAAKAYITIHEALKDGDK